MNLDDFSFIKLAHDEEKKPVITIRAQSGEDTTGRLELTRTDDKGEHAATKWSLAVDLPDGCTHVIAQPDLTLQLVETKSRRRTPRRRQ